MPCCSPWWSSSSERMRGTYRDHRRVICCLYVTPWSRYALNEHSGYSTGGGLLHRQFAAQAYVCRVIDLCAACNILLRFCRESGPLGNLVRDANVKGV